VIEKLESISARLAELDEIVADPVLAKDAVRYRESMRERARLGVIVEVYDEYKSVGASLADARSLARDEADPEMRELAHEEQRGLELRLAALEAKLQELLAPRDPLADKPAIMEIRAGTGGEEAALFAADLFRMYSRFADKRGWKIEVMETSGTELGGFREIVFSVTGDAVYEHLRWESGVHRVQRVPATEASGRIHTSAVTVAVLADDVQETRADSPVLGLEAPREDLNLLDRRGIEREVGVVRAGILQGDAVQSDVGLPDPATAYAEPVPVGAAYQRDPFDRSDKLVET
jgi:peptide chain release factor 1